MQDSLNMLLTPCTDYSEDFIEHHGVKGMHWGVRKRKMNSGKRESFLKRLNDRATERTLNSILNNTRKKTIKQINKLENKQYKLAKPYADKNGHFKITDPKKASKHSEYSEKIVNLKKLLKDIDDGRKEVNKKYSGTSMDYIHQAHLQAHLQAHQIATQQHMNFMHQVQQQNTLQTIQNFHNQMHFDTMTNIHYMNMHTMGMF